MRTIDELEQDLHSVALPHGSGPDLGAIHSQGRRRRLGRSLGAGAAGLAALAVIGGAVGLAEFGSGPDKLAVATEAPTPLAPRPLALRALKEIPGAKQTSTWQVTIPAPQEPLESMGIMLKPNEIESPVVGMGVHLTMGPTAWQRGAFPRWLYQGISDYEQRILGSPNEHPVGSTGYGVLVDVGEAQLACVRPVYTGGVQAEHCSPAVLRDTGKGYDLQWSMGTDRFLKPDAPMEVFVTQRERTGTNQEWALAGIHGTGVDRVLFLNTEGAQVEGTVQAGTIVPGDSLFYASVPGTIARVIAYDASGGVIEDHQVRECSGGVDCEVR